MPELGSVEEGERRAEKRNAIGGSPNARCQRDQTGDLLARRRHRERRLRGRRRSHRHERYLKRTAARRRSETADRLVDERNDVVDVVLPVSKVRRRPCQ